MQPIAGHLDGADLGVLAAYFVLVFAVGIWVSYCFPIICISRYAESLLFVLILFSPHAEIEVPSVVTSWLDVR